MTIELNISNFRSAFKAYESEANYPDAILELRYAQGACYISDNDIGKLSSKCRELALQLMLAHLLNINDKIESGAATGQIVSASEDGVSVSLTPPPNESQFDWWLNTTPYGSQISTMLSLNTVGGLYLGGSFERSGFRKSGGRF